jgi:N-acetylneuraminate synthase/N,N'-diacetyllegionaminate synthase
MISSQREIVVDGRVIGNGQPAFVIAEAGVNHNGQVELARQLVDAAVAAGADAVKFQSFVAEQVISPSAPKAQYQLAHTNAEESQLEMVRQLELSADEQRMLHQYCGERGIMFLSTPFDRGSADLLFELGVAAFKIASGEVTNLPFLQYVARYQKPVILSTGMSYLNEVEQALATIRAAGNDQVALLHCVSSYPAPAAETNLRAMQTMAEAFGAPVGLSDHTLGITVALAAAALGAAVVEKHLTLDKSMPGPDHTASLEPHEFKSLVEGIRIVESSLGNGIKEPVAAEADTRRVARRSLVTATSLAQGTVLQPEMLSEMRPGTGIPPTSISEVLGRMLKHDLAAGQLLSWSDLQ